MDDLDVQKGEKYWKQLLNFTDNGLKEIKVIPGKTLGIRTAFGMMVKSIIQEQRNIKGSKRSQDSQENIQIREYYESLKPTSNGDVIVNPTFSQNPDGSMNINAQVGKYQTYHAVNGLRNGLGVTQINLSENIPYKVLSAGVVMFHKGTNTFYLFKRPIDSQEAPGEVDILGGCLNVTDGMEDGIIFPDRFVTSRMQKKAGLSVDPNHLNCLGVQEFQKRGFYNIVYLYELSDEQTPHLLRKGALLPISYKEAMVVKNQDGPGGAGLSLAINYLQK